MVSVRILDQTYTLPTAATEGFRRLQEQIQLRQRLIQEGVRPQSRRWGLMSRVPTPLSVAERLQELHLLIHDYDTIIAELQVSKEAYDAFFTQLAVGVQRAVQRQRTRYARSSRSVRRCRRRQWPSRMRRWHSGRSRVPSN